MTSPAVIAVKIHPRAKRNAITGKIGPVFKVDLTAPPIEGRANEACIDFFSDLLRLPHSSITIASGKKNRNKTIRITGLSHEKLQKRLNTLV